MNRRDGLCVEQGELTRNETIFQFHPLPFLSGPRRSFPRPILKDSLVVTFDQRTRIGFCRIVKLRIDFGIHGAQPYSDGVANRTRILPEFVRSLDSCVVCSVIGSPQSTIFQAAANILPRFAGL